MENNWAWALCIQMRLRWGLEPCAPNALQTCDMALLSPREETPLNSCHAPCFNTPQSFLVGCMQWIGHISFYKQEQKDGAFLSRWRDLWFIPTWWSILEWVKEELCLLHLAELVTSVFNHKENQSKFQNNAFCAYPPTLFWSPLPDRLLS